MGGLEKKPVAHVLPANILHHGMGRRLCVNWHIFVQPGMCVFCSAATSLQIAHCIEHTRLVKPTPLNAYVGCYATFASPIIFVSWLLLLFYDFGESTKTPT